MDRLWHLMALMLVLFHFLWPEMARKRLSSRICVGWETEFARVVDGSYFPDFTAEMMAKDIELGQNLAKKHQVPMLIHGQVAQIYEMCMAKYGKDSGSTIPVR